MILHNPWLVLHSPSSCGPPHHCLVCARPLSPPNTDVTCTSFRKTVRQAGWEENTASWILSYLMPQCPQQLGEVITGEILLSLHSCQECTNRYLQVPSLSLGLATKVNTGQEREGRWGEDHLLPWPVLPPWAAHWRAGYIWNASQTSLKRASCFWYQLSQKERVLAKVWDFCQNPRR